MEGGATLPEDPATVPSVCSVKVNISRRKGSHYKGVSALVSPPCGGGVVEPKLCLSQQVGKRGHGGGGGDGE